MRKLAGNNWFLKAIFGLLITCLIVLIIYNFWEIDSIWKYVVLCSICLIGFALVFKKVKKSWALFFDSEKMILKRNNVERVITFKHIVSIQHVAGDTKILGLTYKSYKIEFENEKNKTETIDFMVSDLNTEIENFSELVERQRIPIGKTDIGRKQP